MDGGIGIVIVFIIIGLISAVSSAAKKKSGSDNGQDGQPPRRTMSDIQRAFMMMSGLENDEEEQPGQPAPPQRPGYVPPAPRPTYRPPEAHSEGASGYGSVASGSMHGDFTKPGAGSMQYNGLPTSGQGYGVTEASFEGTHFETLAARSDLSEDRSLGHRLDESAEIGDAEDLRSERAMEQVHFRPALKIFENQDDYVKAIVYSEILTRRVSGRRIR